ncbi:MAG TPA: hypothetical protein PLZ21_09195 [Armatimonadota bacterium]|nr:hypothetical protein [Armatimonadota bacterium]
MSPLKTGDRVRIVDRQMTAADTKSGLYYDYFRGLVGTIERIYEDKSVSLRVELESLPEDVLQRHLEIQDTAKNRWLSGLGQETRERLSEAQKNVTLTYTILVGLDDLEPFGKGKSAARPKPKAATQSAEAVVAAKPKAKEKAEVERPSEKDLEKAEEDYLKRIIDRAKDNK